MKFDFSLSWATMVSWAVTLMIAGATYGVLSSRVEATIDKVESDNAKIELLQNTVNELRVELATQSGDVKVIRAGIDAVVDRMDRISAAIVRMQESKK